MNVNNVNSMTMGHTAVSYAVADDQRPTNDEAIGPITPTADTANSATDDTGGFIADDSPKVKGVIRLLQEGHFKGVADVRLRINFNDEITAMEQAEANRITDQATGDIMQTINSEIDALLQSGQIDQPTADLVAASQSAFNNDITGASDDTLNRLRSGFDNLVVSLTAAFNPSPESTENETPAIVDPNDSTDEVTEKSAGPGNTDITTPEVSSSFDFEQFLAGLIETFSAKMNELEASLDNIKVLPELSQPKGKGGAYEKFLAIYNSMRGVDAQAEAAGSYDAVA